MAVEAYYTSEHFKQRKRLQADGDPRALVCFCIDVSRSMDEWWIEPGGLTRNTGSANVDGHNVNYFNFQDIRPGAEYYKKMDKLNETLGALLNDIRRDQDLCRQVAVSIVTYSNFAKVKYDFLDCEDLRVEDCMCAVEKDATVMGDGIRTSLAQIDEMRNELIAADNDHYTPILVFMTDGTPTDDPRQEFNEIRERVESGDLFIFPLGIGDGADMNRLRQMYPSKQIPPQFSTKYKMVKPGDYRAIFQEIKSHVKRRLTVMVSEGESVQSAPAMQSQTVVNNQMGKFMLDSDDIMERWMSQGLV